MWGDLLEQTGKRGGEARRGEVEDGAERGEELGFGESAGVGGGVAGVAIVPPIGGDEGAVKLCVP
jgi:hypothetical protein